MSFTLPKATDQTFEDCPVGLWLFKLKLMEDGIEGSPEYGGGERVKWVFVAEKAISVEEPDATRDNPDPKSVDDWIGEEVWGFTSKSMAKKATMRAWAEALLGREIADTDTLNASDLLGKRAKATVGRGMTGRQKITAMMPYKPKARAAVVEDDEEDDAPATLPF